MGQQQFDTSELACIGWDQHDRVFQPWDGLKQLQLVFFFHGVGNAIGVDHIAVESLWLQPHMMRSVWKAPEFSLE